MQASLKDIAEQIDQLSRVRRLQAADGMSGSFDEAPAVDPRQLTVKATTPRPSAWPHGMLARGAKVAYWAGLFLSLVWLLVCPLLFPEAGRRSDSEFVNLMSILSVWLIPAAAIYLAGLSVRFIILGERRC